MVSMVLNSKVNVLTPETAPFVHFQLVSEPLRRFLGLNQGVGGMLDLEFFKKKLFFRKNFLLQNSFYQMLITFPLFFYLVHTVGWGVET